MNRIGKKRENVIEGSLLFLSFAGMDPGRGEEENTATSPREKANREKLDR